MLQWVTMREVPQRLVSPSEETPLKRRRRRRRKKKKNQISVSITLSNSILNCSTLLALFTASAGSLFHIGAILYVKKFPHWLVLNLFSSSFHPFDLVRLLLKVNRCLNLYACVSSSWLYPIIDIVCGFNRIYSRLKSKLVITASTWTSHSPRKRNGDCTSVL